MKIQAISMPSASGAYNTRQNNKNNFKGGAVVAVPVYQQEEDSFGVWAAKYAATGALFSLAVDLGQNAVSHFNKNVESIPVKTMLKNVPKVVGVVLLLSGIFKLVDKALNRD